MCTGEVEMKVWMRPRRAGLIAQTIADGAKREPGGGKAGSQFHRLRQNIGGAGKIAFRGAIKRPLVTPVGDEIAGRNKQRAGLAHRSRPSKQCLFITGDAS